MIQAIVAGLFLYLIYGLVYRLYLSPIAHFPGPKLAAVTFWYEFYYDIILGGKYIWKIKELHEKYGPIIRINPYELHVIDPAFWEVMYSHGSNNNKRDKWVWHTRGMGIDTSLLGTTDHNIHRHRRQAVNPFFSMQNVRKLQPVVEERVQMLMKRLKQLGSTGEVMTMEYAFSAFTNDVVMQYCFGRSDHRLEADGFDPSFYKTSFASGLAIIPLRHMNWILKIVQALPESIAVKMGEEIAANVKLKNERISQIDEIRSRGTKVSINGDTPTILHTLLESDLPEHEKATERLADEAVLLVGAGTTTTSWVLTVIAFHLLENPTLLERLKHELKTAIPNPGASVPLAELEKLPYLTGVLKEGLRLAYGMASRSARIAPENTIQYKNWAIPPGTPVSMTIPHTHLDESIFPDAASFNPDRWLQNESGHLDKYLLSFSRGSRSCAGLNLGWSELYICISTVFRSFGSEKFRVESDIGVMELYETDAGDVELVSDRFWPIPKEGSKGVRVKISMK